MRAAITAGKNGYSEWPLTTTATESEELLAMAEANGVRHIAGLQRRVGPSARYARDLVKQGYAGKLRSARMTVSGDAFPQPCREDTSGLPRFQFLKCPVGLLAHFGDMLFRPVGFPNKQHRTGLQIDITGTEGVLRIANLRAFENKEDNHVEGMGGEESSLALPVPSEYHSLAVYRTVSQL